MPGTVEDFVATAESLVGKTPYVFGGTSPAGIDCSGLPYWSARVNGVSIARTTQGQWATLEHIAVPEYGCLISFDVPSDGPPQPQHTGIWLAPNLMVSAPHTGLKVMYSTIPNVPACSIMGYLRINGFAEPPPPPPKPEPLPSAPTKEQLMQAIIVNGQVTVFAASPSNHLLQFTATPQGWSVIDITDALTAAGALNGGQPYLVQP